MASSTTTDTSVNAFALYTSFPLPPNSRSIRVLDVQAGLGTEEDDRQISGRLRVIDLEEFPSFTALSYVWGIDCVNAHTITCGAFTIPITANGFSAVRHLRKKLGNFTIWIDAICINQADESEKEQQILLMGSIYSQAKTVYMWLGEGNAQSDRAMAYLATAGFQDYMPSSRTSAGSFKSIFRAWLAVRWSLCTSLIGITSHTLPTSGELKFYSLSKLT